MELTKAASIYLNNVVALEQARKELYSFLTWVQEQTVRKVEEKWLAEAGRALARVNCTKGRGAGSALLFWLEYENGNRSMLEVQVWAPLFDGHGSDMRLKLNWRQEAQLKELVLRKPGAREKFACILKRHGVETETPYERWFAETSFCFVPGDPEASVEHLAEALVGYLAMFHTLKEALE